MRKGGGSRNGRLRGQAWLVVVSGFPYRGMGRTGSALMRARRTDREIDRRLDNVSCMK